METDAQCLLKKFNKELRLFYHSKKNDKEIMAIPDKIPIGIFLFDK